MFSSDQPASAALTQLCWVVRSPAAFATVSSLTTQLGECSFCCVVLSDITRKNWQFRLDTTSFHVLLVHWMQGGRVPLMCFMPLFPRNSSNSPLVKFEPLSLTIVSGRPCVTNFPWKSIGKPSMPGDLFDWNLLIASSHCFKVISPSQDCLASCESFSLKLAKQASWADSSVCLWYTIPCNT